MHIVTKCHLVVLGSIPKWAIFALGVSNTENRKRLVLDGDNSKFVR